MSPQVIGRLSLLCVAVLLTALPARAVTYTEAGDAGEVRATSQATAATQGAANQPLSAIFGTVASLTDIDLFRINITDPLNFSATTVNTVTLNSGLDTELFLFDSNGRPVYANDDVSGTDFRSTLPAGNALGPQVAGVYFIGISVTGAEPTNASNQLLFSSGGLSTDIRGPNPSATGPLTGWDKSGIFPGGTFPASYEIDLTGATTAAVPEPTAFVFAVMGGIGLVGLKRSKRQSNPQSKSAAQSAAR